MTRGSTIDARLITCENYSGSTRTISHGIANEIDSSQTVIVPQLQHMGLVERPDLFLDPLLKCLEPPND
jgi:(E)-2-((N-methylformamido)methylene)succinate hydrolase